ncbi:MAG: methyltransferase [Nanoarchaeota archaeon]|nr:methyltransferase [Nanoarchaeota archaeon]
MRNPTYPEYLEGTSKVLEESQKEGAHYIGFKGKKLVVRPNVFSPKYFHDSRFFANNIPIIAGQSFLEIGPGCGIASINAALNGASRVLAIDSNPNAVNNTEENAKRYGVENIVESAFGNLFNVWMRNPSVHRELQKSTKIKYNEFDRTGSPAEVNEQFDSIFWNVPFGYVPSDRNLTRLEEAVFDKEYKNIKKFIKLAPEHLNQNGLIHMGFSNTLGMPEILQRTLSNNGFNYEIIARTKSKEVHPVTFELYEARFKVYSASSSSLTPLIVT